MYLKHYFKILLKNEQNVSLIVHLNRSQGKLQKDEKIGWKFCKKCTIAFAFRFKTVFMCAKLTRTMISNWYFVPIGKIKIKKKVEKYFWMVYNRVWTIADQGSSML